MKIGFDVKTNYILEMKGYSCAGVDWPKQCACNGKVQYGLRMEYGHYLGKRSEMKNVNGTILCHKDNFEGVPEYVHSGRWNNEECWCFPSSNYFIRIRS